jgi:nucleotide-binding universal stress UspA family protein
MIALYHILVATDFGEAGDAAVVYGRALAHRFSARLHLLHVVENVFMRAIAADPRVVETTAAKQLDARLTDDDRQTLDISVATDTSDLPAEAIVRYARAQGIGLIVMGTHGRRGVAHILMGSVAEQVVRTAPCPVLTVRHPEHDFVVADLQREDSHDRTQENSRRH